MKEAAKGFHSSTVVAAENAQSRRVTGLSANAQAPSAAKRAKPPGSPGPITVRRAWVTSFRLESSSSGL